MTKFTAVLTALRAILQLGRAPGSNLESTAFVLTGGSVQEATSTCNLTAPG